MWSCITTVEEKKIEVDDYDQMIIVVNFGIYAVVGVCVQAMSLCWVATALIRLGVYSSFVQVFLPPPHLFQQQLIYVFGTQTATVY